MENKRLIMIAGPAGIGKTAVCRELFGGISGSAWLDADWCWMVNPYPGKTDEQKLYAEKAFGYMLDGYFADPNTHTVLFSWLMHADFMFDRVTAQISHRDYHLTKVALVCDDDEYRRRMVLGNRRQQQIDSRDSMENYLALNAAIIDTTHLSVAEVASKIIGMLV